MAVGSGLHGAVAERWNGKQWSIRRIRGDDGLVAVSCVSNTACSALGSRTTYAAGVFCAKALVEHWNGSRWSHEFSSDFGVCSSGYIATLNALSCTASRACTAVGGTQPEEGPGGSPIALQWDGKRESIPDFGAGNTERYLLDGASLKGVSCTTADECTAVGDLGNAGSTLVESWNGTSWTIEPTPGSSSSNAPSLSDVSCVPRGGCMAVGSAEFDVNPGLIVIKPAAESTFGPR